MMSTEVRGTVRSSTRADRGRRWPERCTWCRLGVSFVIAAVLSVTTFALIAPPAGAHSFLVSTSPAQGERLTEVPETVALEFSEEVDLDTVQVQLTTLGGEDLGAVAVDLVDGGLAVRGVLPAIGDGVYVVSWEALSAIDGHGSAGEFAFAMGSGDASIPTATTASSTDASSLIAAWMFVAGMALAVGALVVSLVAPEHRLAVALSGRLGFVAAGFGVLVELSVTNSGTLTLSFVLQALLVGVIAVGFRKPWWTLIPATAALALWSSRSHGADEGWLGWALDAVHLAAGTAWLGSLAVVIVLGVRLRRTGRPWIPLIAKYSRPALLFVVALGVAGIVAAWRLVPSWDDLWTTGYGQIVVAKTVLFGAALVAAGTARWFGLRHQRTSALAGAVGIELPLVLVAAMLAGVLTASAPPSPVSAAELLGPTPLRGDVTRDAGLAGNLTVALEADGERADIRVLVGSGPIPGTDISVSVVAPDGEETDLVPRPCGTGCVTQALTLADGITQLNVTATAPDWTGGTYVGALQWPPGDLAPDRVRTLIDTMRAIPDLTLTETVDSGPGSLATPAVYTISGDQLIDAEPYAGGNVEDVRELPGPGDRLSIYVPGSQFYAVLHLDEQGRIIAARMVDPGHLITRTITYPDE